jgi:hypothetical protein
MTSKSNLKTNLIKVEKGYISDLENILDDILIHFNIYNKEDGAFSKKITKNDLMDLYITPLIQKEKQYQCSAILLNGNRCSHKSLKDTRYKYCKKHFFKDKQNLTNLEIMSCTGPNKLGNSSGTEEVDNGDSKFFVMNSLTEDIELKKDKLQKHFIHDKLYYIDEKYIYDENYCKAGYIENNDNDNNDNVDNDNIKNYILIHDPFVLQHI